MTVINVCQYIGTPNLLSPNKGMRLRNKIMGNLKEHISVTLDFSGYKYISSSFLNEAIGKLCFEMNWNLDTFKKKIRWKNLLEDDELDILIAVENSQTKLFLKKNNMNQQKFYQSTLPAF